MLHADSRDHVTFPPRVTCTVRERNLAVSLARVQETQILREITVQETNFNFMLKKTVQKCYYALLI